MINKFIKSLKKKKNFPKHIGLAYTDYSTKNAKIPAVQLFKNKLEKIKELIDIQFEYSVPVFTIYLVSAKERENVHYSDIMEAVSHFFDELAKENKISEHKIKVSVLGKWYNLPSRVVESIKKVIDETRDYDGYFLNFCVNYDGQEEIVDACRLIARRVSANKVDADGITKELIKENLYSSYFLPPELIIVTNKKKDLDGFLLWDSVNANIYFSDKLWREFSMNDMLKAVMQWQKWRRENI